MVHKPTVPTDSLNASATDSAVPQPKNETLQYTTKPLQFPPYVSVQCYKRATCFGSSTNLVNGQHTKNAPVDAAAASAAAADDDGGG